MNNIMDYINNIDNNSITLESLFNFSYTNKKDVMNSWYSKIFSGNSFLGNSFSLFSNVDTDNDYIYIKRVDYKKLLKRIKDTYGERNIEKIFIKSYNENDMRKFNKKKISRQKMRIENVKTPNFFSLELAIIFNDLYEKYRESTYGRISKQIYTKSWIATSDKTNVSKISLNNLDKISLTLNDYQKEFIENYDILKSHLNLDGFILTFEQGMGKTLTSIALAECLNSDNVYIVCPNTVQENWMLEIRKYYNRYSSNPELWKKEVVKCADNNATKNARFFIINNESIPKMFPYIKSGNNFLIIDESQNFRNNSGKRVSELLELKDKLKPKNILAMSGTPIKASPNELVPIMRLIDPLFTEEASSIYDKCFNLDNSQAMNIVNDRFGKIIYRKTKEILDLPEKKVDNLSYTINKPDKFLLSNVKHEISTRFNEIYSERLKENESLRKEFVNLITRYSTSNNNDKNRYLNWVVKTVNTGKEIALHELDVEFMNTYIERFILTNNIDPKIYDRINWLNTNFIKMKQSSMGKAIGEILPKRRRDMFISIYDDNREDIIKRIMDNNEKTIIFSQLKGVIDYICDSLNKDGIKTVKITGDIKDRLPILMQFKEDDETLVLCATSQSLGTGVTLIEASQMFFFGAPWRSADFDQCTDRIHRIGQKVDVQIYNVLLNTSTKNLSSRMNDILNWSGEMFDSAIKQLEGDNPIMDIYANESYNEGENLMFNDIANESATNKNIPEIEETFKNDPIRKAISTMIACSHEYKDKPNVEAGIKFAKNYNWTEKNISLDKLQGINKPVIKEKVFEIAKSMDKKDSNKWPVICVDKIHGIYPQSKGMSILFDGHHRLEAMKFVGLKETPCYYGKYNGGSEKDLDELKESNESYKYKEGNIMNSSLDEFIATCESMTITEDIANEGFFDRFKKKPQHETITRKEYKTTFLPKLKNIYNKSKSDIQNILKKPEHKLAAKGFKMASNSSEHFEDSPFDINIVDWDLWKIYSDARSRFGENTPEYDSLYRELDKCIKSHAILEFPNAKTEDYGDWDDGTICVHIPGLRIDDSANESVETYSLTEEDEAVLESYLEKATESKLTAEQRIALPDSAFGLISDGKRKYPLFLKDPEESKRHIRQAIKFFHFCPLKDRGELSKNIMKAAKKYGIEIDEKSMIRKYL